jgi:hypothetical protein
MVYGVKKESKVPMPHPKAITISLEDIDLGTFNRVALSSPFYSRENFVYIAIHSLLEEHEPNPRPVVQDRYLGYGRFSNSIRYF